MLTCCCFAVVVFALVILCLFSLALKRSAARRCSLQFRLSLSLALSASGRCSLQFRRLSLSLARSLSRSSLLALCLLFLALWRSLSLCSSVELCLLALCRSLSRRPQNSRVFFLKISKEIGKACLKSLTRAKRIFSVSPQVSLSVFSLGPDLLFDCSRVLEYAKTRTFLQSNFPAALHLTPVFYTYLFYYRLLT